MQEIVRELQGATLGGHALLAVLPKLRRLLEAERVAAFRPVRTGAGWKLDFAFLEGFAAGMEKLATDWFATAPADAFFFDPYMPQADQRNVVLRTRADLPADEAAKAPAVRDLFPKLGLAGMDQIRVLICEGDQVLAWVGAFRIRTFTELDEQRFAALVPAMQSRLSLEASLYK